MGRTLSKADQALFEELTDLGRAGITARQLERWRQAGVIRTVRTRRSGRGGSSSHYPPGTARHLVAFARTLAELGSIPRAVLVHFVNGNPVTEKGVRGAYDKVYTAIETYGMARSTSGEDDEDDAFARAERIAASPAFKRNRIVQAWKRNLRTYSGRTESLQREIWNTGSTVVHTLQTGTQPSEDAAAAIGTAAGFDADKEFTRQFADQLTCLSIPGIKEIVGRANLDELITATRDIRIVFDALDADPNATVVLPKPDPLILALTAPATIPMRQVMGPAADAFYAQLKETIRDRQ